MTWDENYLLHNNERSCMEFRDGYDVWQINGVRVDKQIVVCPETQSVEQINNEENEEVRRLRIER